ncbi:MAG: mono/diheme cytochrome c family protein [Bacteroidia bacterium]|jgi:mono/diheme cytochrome c family protein
MQFLQNRKNRINGLLLIAASTLVSCSAGGNKTGYEYAPNMYESEAYEAYTQTGDMQYNPHGMTMRTPVEGAVANGQLGYTMYAEGYEASDGWRNPIAATESNVAEGMRLYNIQCQHCHGKKGKNDGGVIKSGQYPPPPWDGYASDNIKDLSDGKMFHSISFGKGNMGAHGNVLTPAERWKVLHYVRLLSLGDAFVYAPEGTEDNVDLVAMDAKSFDGFDLADIGGDLNMINGAMRNVKFNGMAYKKFEETSTSHIDKVAEYMISHPDLKAIVVGHVASKVNIPGFGELSLIRAKTVCDYLEAKGISRDRLSPKGKGSSSPVTSNDTKEGKDINRRVEIYFIK